MRILSANSPLSILTEKIQQKQKLQVRGNHEILRGLELSENVEISLFNIPQLLNITKTGWHKLAPRVCKHSSRV